MVRAAAAGAGCLAAPAQWQPSLECPSWRPGTYQFAAPGHFAAAHDPERLRAETMLAIAEHDNGWWEWEAIPERGDLDDHPPDLAGVLKSQQEGMNRWRLGIPRFSEEHPCVSLLISFRAYRLHAL